MKIALLSMLLSIAVVGMTLLLIYFSVFLALWFDYFFLNLYLPGMVGVLIGDKRVYTIALILLLLLLLILGVNWQVPILLLNLIAAFVNFLVWRDPSYLFFWEIKAHKPFSHLKWKHVKEEKELYPAPILYHVLAAKYAYPLYPRYSAMVAPWIKGYRDYEYLLEAFSSDSRNRVILEKYCLLSSLAKERWEEGNYKEAEEIIVHLIAIAEKYIKKVGMLGR